MLHTPSLKQDRLNLIYKRRVNQDESEDDDCEGYSKKKKVNSDAILPEIIPKGVEVCC